MHFPIVRLLVVGTVLAAIQLSVASPLAPNHELDRILAKLASTASTDQYRQVADAVRSSPRLSDQLNGLAASGKLT